VVDRKIGLERVKVVSSALKTPEDGSLKFL
jgi:hypothetical protein